MEKPPVILPPGTLLLHMFLKERLKKLQPGRFVEIGVGQGHLSRLLLEMGWEGIGYDLNPEALGETAKHTETAIQAGRYALRNADWLSDETDEQFDLVISCMVLEHLDDEAEKRYFDKCRQSLAPDGRLILFVPGSPGSWGIEDEIAGHMRRYSHVLIEQRISEAEFECQRVDGLTFPLSNLLLPVSNWLVSRAERKKLALGVQERTVQSGNRAVPFKTTFPGIAGLILNRFVLYPFHILQKLNRNHPNALILYAEGRKAHP